MTCILYTKPKYIMYTCTVRVIVTKFFLFLLPPVLSDLSSHMLPQQGDARVIVTLFPVDLALPRLLTSCLSHIPDELVSHEIRIKILSFMHFLILQLLLQGRWPIKVSCIRPFFQLAISITAFLRANEIKTSNYIYILIFAERHFPCGITPSIRLVHTMRNLQLLSELEARAGVQLVQHDGPVHRPAGRHHCLVFLHSRRNLQQKSSKQRFKFF